MPKPKPSNPDLAVQESLTSGKSNISGVVFNVETDSSRIETQSMLMNRSKSMLNENSKLPKSSISPFRSNIIKTQGAKEVISKLTGVGHLVIPKDIKFQKWLISTLLFTLFMFSSIVNGGIIYGIESAIYDTCYSPFHKIYYENNKSYQCPSFAGGFVKESYAWLIRIFELGSTLHTISIGIASTGVYYLNFSLIVLYIILFLVGYTMMLMAAIFEIFIFKVGLLIYFKLQQSYLLGFLIYFLVDIIHLFATINLEVRWINFLG